MTLMVDSTVKNSFLSKSTLVHFYVNTDICLFDVVSLLLHLLMLYKCHLLFRLTVRYDFLQLKCCVSVHESNVSTEGEEMER